jgi:hypothetical protein
MANPHLPAAYINGLVVHQFTTQDGTTKVILKTDAGEHITQAMPFSVESYEGRRVRRIDGKWVLRSREAA